MSDAAPLYFGCIGQAGHYHWTTSLESAGLERDLTPWGLAVDGELTPKVTRRQGVAALAHRDGWTALSVHDYTVDKRPGSHSTFLFPEPDLDFDTAVARARTHFPTITARVGPITDEAALAAGGSVRDVARTGGISTSTVQTWTKEKHDA